MTHQEWASKNIALCRAADVVDVGTRKSEGALSPDPALCNLARPTRETRPHPPPQ